MFARHAARPLTLLSLCLALVAVLQPLALSAQGVLVRTRNRATYHGELAERMGEAADTPAEVTRTLAVRDGRLHLEGFPEAERLPTGEWAMYTVIDLEEERAHVIVPSAREHHVLPLEELVEEVRGEIPSPEDRETEFRVEATGEEAEIRGLPARRVLLTVNLGPDRYFGGELHLFAEMWLSRAPELQPLLDYQERVGERYRHLGLGSPLDAIRTALGGRDGGSVGNVVTEVDGEEALRGLAVSASLFVVTVEEGSEIDADALLRFDGAGQAEGQEVLIRTTSELAELRTEGLPDSLFRAPPGSRLGRGPTLGRELAERIREEGVEAAVRWYRGLAETDPYGYRYGPFQLQLIAREFQDRPEVTRALYELGAEARPYDPSAHRSAASAYREAGLEERAVTAYRRALELDPWDGTSREALESMGAAVDPPPEPGAEVAAATLERYAGSYEGELRRLGVHPMTDDELATQTVRFRITPDGSGLRFEVESARAEGLFGGRLVPISATRFVNGDVEEKGLQLYLDFGHGEEDEVELRQVRTGRRILARRVER